MHIPLHVKDRIRTTRSRGRITLAAVLAAVALTIAGCAAPPAVDGPDTLRVGVEFLPGSFSPTIASPFTLAERAVYETLFEAYSGLSMGGFEPQLATGYEQSEDWKTVTITLRDGVTFVDGEEFTASGLKTYLEGLAGREDWGYLADWQGASPELIVDDDLTLTIRSEKPMAPGGFLYVLLTVIPIASPASLDDLEATATEPLGTGPYVVESWTPEVDITLVRNENHWNPDAYLFDRIEMTVFADEVAALNALSSGQIDATLLTASLASEAEGRGFTINEAEFGGKSAMLAIEDREGTIVPALADVRVRQAISLAFDREAINEAINHGYGDVTSQPFIETQPEYVPDGDDRYGYDPERARELLAEAGYPDGFDLVIPSTSIFGISTWAPIVEQYLGDIGIRVTFETLEPGDFFDSTINATTYPVVMYFTESFNTLVLFVNPDGVFNAFVADEPFVTERWGVMQTGPDEAAERAMSELGEYVLDEAIVIPFSTPRLLWVTAPWLTITHQVGIAMLDDFAYADE